MQIVLQCHDSILQMDFFSFVIPFLSSLCSPFVTTFVLSSDYPFVTHDLDSACTIVTHPRIPVLGPEGCTMTHGLTTWLTLVAFICYRLCIFNYKYRVVAVVRPQSCLCPFLAIHCIPLNCCLTWAAMPSSEPQSHWITEPLHSRHHAHVEHTKTLQGLDMQQVYKQHVLLQSMCTHLQCRVEWYSEKWPQNVWK